MARMEKPPTEIAAKLTALNWSLLQHLPEGEGGMLECLQCMAHRVLGAAPANQVAADWGPAHVCKPAGATGKPAA